MVPSRATRVQGEGWSAEWGRASHGRHCSLRPGSKINSWKLGSCTLRQMCKYTHPNTVCTREFTGLHKHKEGKQTGACALTYVHALFGVSGHTHTDRQTHTHTCIHTQTHTHMHTHTDTVKCGYSHSQTHANAHTGTQANDVLICVHA